MKKLLLFLFSAFAFAACEQAPIEEAHGVADSNRSLSVSFEGDDTRIQLNEAQKTVWTKGDHVSVFYRSTVNEEWQFMGETGDRTGQIVPVDDSINPPATHNRVVVIYPYNNEYYLNTETYSIEASLPAVQTYLKDSYGTNGNIMVSSNDYKQVSLKSVCGWLKLQLTGYGEIVKSITLKGNNGEQVAGELHINTSDATCVLASASGEAGESEVGGTLVRPGTILTEVTLDCSDGVTLGAEATAFYIALPPQTFEKGFTVDIKSDGYEPMILSTSNALTIKRNHIQPMAGVEHNAIPVVPNNQIWYTSSDDDVVTPYNTKVFGANIISNTYNNGKGVITFDGDVTTIGEDAFYNCTSLTSMNIGDSVTEIGWHAFYSCTSLTSVTIPDSVTTIGINAFTGCTSLTSVNIPDSVTTIGSWAFSSCTSLTSITIPDRVTSIGKYAFADCNSLTEFKGKIAKDNGRILVVDGVLTAFAPAGITEYNIPDCVTKIGDYAFCDCDSLTSVTIPDSVTSIGESAFAFCKILTEFTGKFAEDNGRILVVDGVLTAFAPAGITEYNIPDSVTTIGGWAFNNCDSLTSVNIPDSVTSIGNMAFYNCTSLTSVNIPDSVTTIGENAFYYCTSLTSVNIGDSVTEIGEYAFAYCYSLTSVNIPDSVTTIGYAAFAWCYSLTSVNIPDSVTTIGACAFHSCDSLISVNIPNSVTEIGEGAFYDCTSLTSVYCEATTPPALGWSVFYNNGSGRKIYVPVGSVNAYKSAEYWSEYASDIVGYDFDKGEVVGMPPNNEILYTSSDGNVVEPYDTNVFGANIVSNTYTNGMGIITFDGDVTSIGEGAFYNCYSLTSVNIPDSVTTIDYAAFAGCTSLISVNIPDSVTTIEDYAFWNCYSLTSVNIPDSVNTIGMYAFRFCDSLKSVNIPDSVTTIGEGAFYGCTSLKEFKGKFASEDDRFLIIDGVLNSFTIGCGVTEYTIPDSVTTIGNYAFYNCDSLTSVTIPNSVTTIGNMAFYDCDSLTSVNIPDSVTKIGNDAFQSCYSLTEFKGKFASEDGRCLIIDGVHNSFAPYGLTQYTIPDSVTTIGNYAFYNYYSLTSVTIPDSVTTIGNYAFAYCYSLTSVNIPDSVTTIGSQAFDYCDSLTSVYCKATTPPALGGTTVFDNNGSGRKIYVPTESVDAYKSATNWSDYKWAIIGYDFETGEVVE